MGEEVIEQKDIDNPAGLIGRLFTSITCGSVQISDVVRVIGLCNTPDVQVMGITDRTPWKIDRSKFITDFSEVEILFKSQLLSHKA
jgi:hypothetical protein